MTFDLGQSIDILRRTPPVLRALLAGVDERWSGADEGPGTFRPFDVVGHLIDGEETDWIPRAQIILAQGPDRRFTPFDREGMRRVSEGKSLAELLDDFDKARAESLRVLRGWKLRDAQLDLTGVHPAFGDVTLRQLLATWVVHDLGHVAQVARVMAKQYRDAIGPWRAYLPVVDR